MNLKPLSEIAEGDAICIHYPSQMREHGLSYVVSFAQKIERTETRIIIGTAAGTLRIPEVNGDFSTMATLETKEGTKYDAIAYCPK